MPKEIHPETSVSDKRIKFLILLSITAIYFFSYFHRVGIPGTIFNELQTEFGISATAVAVLGALYLYIYGGMQFFAGVMADGLGAARTVLLGGLWLSLGSLLFPLAHSLSFLYGARSLIGFGASLIYISVVKEVDNLYGPRDFPLYLSIALVLGYSGGLFGTLPFERAVFYLGWRKVLFIAGLLCTGALVCAACLLKRYNRIGKINPFSKQAVRGVVRNKLSLPVVLSGSVNFSIYFLVQATIGKKLLEDCTDMSSSLAASFTFGMMLFTILVNFVYGFVTRHMERRKPAILVSTAITLVATAIMIFVLGTPAPDAKWFFFCYSLLAISAGAALVFITSMKELNPVGMAGTAVGFLNGICYLTVALVSNLAGVVMDHFKPYAVQQAGAFVYPAVAYRVIFAGCFSLAVCSFIISLFISEPRQV